MADFNKANRQTCDVDIRSFKTKAPILFFDTANTTTAGLDADKTYAMAKGTKKIGFDNPLNATMSLTAQVYPFKLFSLLSDGVIETNAIYADRQVIKATVAGKLKITAPGSGTIEAGTVFVYPEGEYGYEDKVIAGTYTDGEFTATSTEDIVIDSEYAVAYMVNRTGVKKVAFNNKKLPKDYFITQKTLDKNENDELTPFVMTAYKAAIQRKLELSFASEGDAASITLNFDLLEDKDGNQFDMVELSEDAE